MSRKNWQIRPCEICGDKVRRSFDRYERLRDPITFKKVVAHSDCVALDQIRKMAIAKDEPNTKVEFLLRSKLLTTMKRQTQQIQRAEEERKAQLRSRNQKIRVIKNSADRVDELLAA